MLLLQIWMTPFDKGAKDYQKANFPRHSNITFERARVTNINNEILITLPIKVYLNIEHKRIINCIRSLTDPRITNNFY